MFLDLLTLSAFVSSLSFFHQVEQEKILKVKWKRISNNVILRIIFPFFFFEYDYRIRLQNTMIKIILYLSIRNLYIYTRSCMMNFLQGNA